ncbi:hypothetical protein D3C81_1840400 [compost metagenome]
MQFGVDPQRTILGQFHALHERSGRCDTGTQQHQRRRQLLAIGQQHGVDPFFTEEALDLGRAMEHHALALMQRAYAAPDTLT